MVELDNKDREILAALQQDASISVAHLAERVNLTTNPCWRRVKRLEDAGVIRAKVALLDTAVVGLRTTAFVTIRIDRHAQDWLTEFAAAVEAIPEIVECHRMTGDIDYLLKVVIADLHHYDLVYKRLIEDIPHLTDVSSAFSMERLKETTAVDLATLP
ncbi:MAG: Lrp/AsnC family transcriptional regulator [Pseudomonadota bacterium]